MISSVSWLISEEFGALATALGLAALPLAITVAILKYRLYDIKEQDRPRGPALDAAGFSPAGISFHIP